MLPIWIASLIETQSTEILEKGYIQIFSLVSQEPLGWKSDMTDVK